MLAQTNEDTLRNIVSNVNGEHCSETRLKRIFHILGKYIDITDLRGDDINQVDKWLENQAERTAQLENENREYKRMLMKFESTMMNFDDIFTVIHRHMKGETEGENMISAQQIDGWLNNRRNAETKLKREIDEYRHMVANIERGITSLDCKIEHFTECLNSNGDEVEGGGGGGGGMYPHDPYRNMLEYIENEIRQFSDEEVDFEIRDFPLWLQKLQCRLDGLKLELTNEQKLRSREEHEYSMEREILNYLFNQKQKEITILRGGRVAIPGTTLSSNVMRGESFSTVKEELTDTTL